MRRAIFGRLRLAAVVCAILAANCLMVPLASADAPAVQAKPVAATKVDKALHASKAVGVATHRQAKTIAVNAAGKPQVKVNAFCLTPDDRILAGCSGSKGEIRVFDVEGKLLDSWELPVQPEAVFARADGAVFVAGDGQVLKLSPDGKVELSKQSPQAAALNEHPEKLREEVVQQAKQQAEQYKTQTAMYDKLIKQADDQIDSINKKLAAPNKESKAATAREAIDKTMSQRQLEMYKQQKEQYANAKKQWAEMMGGNVSGTLTDKQIDEQVKSSMAYKMKASSISALGEDVFLATHATLGYGFEVWRMNDRFESPTKIVKELSGCCGQMDVKASKDGIFVAENSQHRVCRFDRDGKAIAKWGQSARTGLEGFGSCCNPMNVAFGPDGAVYTSEDDTGRIKRYAINGKLLGLVGAVDLKPGCKNCAIAVSGDGSRVYMLDITRNFIVRLDTRSEKDVASDIDKAKNSPSVTSGASDGSEGGGVLSGVFRALFSE